MCCIQRHYWLILVHFLVSVFKRPSPVATGLFVAILKSKTVSCKLENSVSSVYQECHRTKQLLAAQEVLFPDLYHSLLTAMKPLMARDRVGPESSKL